MIKTPFRETVRMCATTCAPLKGGGASGAVAQTPHFAAPAPPCDTSDFEVAQSGMRHLRATQESCATSTRPITLKKRVSEGEKSPLHGRANTVTAPLGGRDIRDIRDICPPCPSLAGIAPADRFGPWSDRIDAAERLARLRSLRAIVRLTTGPRGDRLASELHRAEGDASRLPFALTALDHLAALDRRQVLASFAQLHRPA